jgi:hypothetical protein
MTAAELIVRSLFTDAARVEIVQIEGSTEVRRASRNRGPDMRVEISEPLCSQLRHRSADHPLLFFVAVDSEIAEAVRLAAGRGEAVENPNQEDEEAPL